MKKIISVVLLMLAFHANAQDSSKFTVELLNNMLNQYQECKIVSPEYAIVGSGEKKGVVDYNGNIVLPIKYRKIEDFSDGMAVVQDENHKYGYVDNNFKIVTPCIYTNATDYINGLAVVSENNDNSKFIDKEGQIDQVSTKLLKCFPTRYKSGFCVSGNLLVIKSPGNVESFQVDSNYVSFYGCAIIMDDNYKHRILTPSGWLKSEVYDNISSHGNYIVTEKMGKKGLIDNNGKEILPCIYEDITPPNQELIAVKKNGKWGILDTSGKQILPFVYKWAEVYNDNIIRIENYKEPYSGIINRNGDNLFQNQPEYIKTINNNAIFKIDGMYYAINNELKTPFSSDKEIMRIYDDFASIIDRNNYKKGLINGFGRLVLPCEYDEINYEYGVFHVKKSGKSSYVECVNIQKIIDEIVYYTHQADSDKEEGKYDEYIAKLKKADEKVMILEKNPELYDSRIANIIKPERERIKGLIDEATKLLNNK